MMVPLYHLYLPSPLSVLLFSFSLKVKYKEDMKDNSINLYSHLPETIETKFAKEMSEMHSEVPKQQPSVCALENKSNMIMMLYLYSFFWGGGGCL